MRSQNRCTPLRSRLTPRETEVITWTARGKTYSEISSALAVTEDTVKAHIENVRTKLSAANKTHAVAIAIFQGLVKSGDMELGKG